MKLPIYPKIGQLCRIREANTKNCKRNWALLQEQPDTIWLGDNDIFLVIKILNYSMYSIKINVLYKDKFGTLIIEPNNIEVLEA